MSAVYQLSRDGSTMTLAAGPHLPKPLRDATHTFPALSTSGACGAALDRREAVVVLDVSLSPIYSEAWRKAARESGVSSVWSTPFFTRDGAPVGTFAMFHAHPGPPSDRERAVVGRAAFLARIAIERQAIEERFVQLVDHIREVFWMGTSDFSKMLFVSRGYEEIWGASRESLFKDPRSWLAAIHRDDRDRVSRIAERDRATGFDIEYRIVRPDGTIRQIRDRAFPIRDQIGPHYCVAGIAEDVTERRQMEDQLRQSEQLLRLVLDAIPVGVAVMRPGGNIFLSNPASTRIWGQMIASGPERYQAVKGWWHDTGRQIEPEEWASVRAMTRGETSLNELLDIEAFDGAKKVILNSGVPIRDERNEIVGAVIINEDVTAKTTAEAEREAVAKKLVLAQDDERRRIAQLLHETTAQDLAALKMLLGRLGRASGAPSDAASFLLKEAVGLADSSMRGVRTLSYLLHPPFLDDVGLLAALRWYVEGFSQRSDILVSLDVPDDLKRLPRTVETTIFRVVQESLINIHRHAHSPSAAIRLAFTGDALVLVVEDKGTGMPAGMVAKLQVGDGAYGVGIAGMRERLKELGGTLEIASSQAGTTIRAIIPIRRTAK